MRSFLLLLLPKKRATRKTMVDEPALNRFDILEASSSSFKIKTQRTSRSQSSRRVESIMSAGHWKLNFDFLIFERKAQTHTSRV
jgi:hypothetical protein